jgi:hypothetical protein
MEEALNGRGNAGIEMILSIMGIVLELLGGVPDYSDRTVLRRYHYYYLHGLRTLQYYQTPYQKVNTILEAIHYKPYCDYHKNDRNDVYGHTYHMDPADFLKWYKEKYPKVYCEIF